LQNTSIQIYFPSPFVQPFFPFLFSPPIPFSSPFFSFLGLLAQTNILIMDSKYRAVPDEEHQTFEKKSLLSPIEEYTRVPPVFARYSTHPYTIWICHGLLLCFSFTFFILSLLLRVNTAPTGICSQPEFPYC
jgi:hypothetical protein